MVLQDRKKLSQSYTVTGKMHFVWTHCQQETWAYTALAGIISFHVGVVVLVFAFKGLLGEEMTKFVPYLGIVVAVAGVTLIIASGVLYRRQRRHLRPCICCGEDYDVTSIALPPYRRLRFAPNLVSPYYIDAVMAEPEHLYITEKVDKQCPSQLFEMSHDSCQATSIISGSQTFASDAGNQTPSFRKELRKTPC